MDTEDRNREDTRPWRLAGLASFVVCTGLAAAACAAHVAPGVETRGGVATHEAQATGSVAALTPGGGPVPLAEALAATPLLSPADVALVVRGASLYPNNCSSCHGDTRAEMGRLADEWWLQQRGDQTLALAIAEGRSLPGAQEAMPGLGTDKGGPLGPDDVNAVLAYVKWMAATAPSDLAEAVAEVDDELEAGAADEEEAGTASGQELYAKYCAGCHGAGGNKVSASKLGDAAWLQQRGDAALTRGIGAGGGTMPGFSKERGGPLGPQQIEAILDYMKSQAGLAP